MPTSDIGGIYRTSFEETHWSVVLRARQPDATGMEALEKLCHTYRLPLYTFVRHRGFNRADAEDLVQDFFVTLLERKRLETVDPKKGKFRSFLLAALKNFLANEWDSRRALKRGGAYRFVSLHDPELESLYAGLAASQVDAERLFDRSWAVALLHHAIAQLSDEYDKEGRGTLFKALKSCLSASGRAFEYDHVARELGMREDNVRMAVSRMRRRFGEILRQQIKNTLPNPGDVDDELKYLLSCL